MIEEICKMLKASEGIEPAVGVYYFYGSVVAVALSIICIVALRRWYSPLLCIPILFLTALFMPQTSVLQGAFNLCCAMICDVAVPLGMRYLETSTMLNLYVQPGILLVLSIIATVRRRNIANIVNASLCGALCVWVLMHYGGMNFQKAGQKCCEDLYDIANLDCGMYVVWNIVIFVLLFAVSSFTSLYGMRDKEKTN